MLCDVARIRIHCGAVIEGSLWSRGDSWVRRTERLCKGRRSRKSGLKTGDRSHNQALSDESAINPQLPVSHGISLLNVTGQTSADGGPRDPSDRHQSKMDPLRDAPTLRRAFPAARSRRDLVTYPTDEKPEACRTEATTADKKLRVAPTSPENPARAQTQSADLHSRIA